jgi:archaellum component FlaF (FlaF/FlaG flagellin family)
MFKKAITLCLISSLIILPTGCYNTYSVELKEFQKIQESYDASFKTIKTKNNISVQITENSRVGVTNKSGTYYPISSFNFSVDANQLIAPDEDLLLEMNDIESMNVRLINPTTTTLLIVGAAAALVGAAIGITLATPECTGDFC